MHVYRSPHSVRDLLSALGCLLSRLLCHHGVCELLSGTVNPSSLNCFFKICLNLTFILLHEPLSSLACLGCHNKAPQGHLWQSNGRFCASILGWGPKIPQAIRHREKTVPRTGWLRHQKFIFSQFWSLESEIRCQQGWFPLRPVSMARTQPSSCGHPRVHVCDPISSYLHL